MTSINFTSLSKRFLPAGVFVLASVLGLIFVLSAAKAETPTSSEAAIAEMEEMFGKIPPRMQKFPKSATAAGWELTKSTDLNKNTALPLKIRELIGLAVASQIPCKYCIYYHQKSARGPLEQQKKRSVRPFIWQV